MGRGRKRKHNPTIPAHVDQTRLPPGMYWDQSGKGRWYVLEPDPEGSNPRKVIVAGPPARLSELEAIMEQRAGGDAQGTIGYVISKFEKSERFTSLAARTQKDYKDYAKAIRKFKTKMGCTLDKLYVDRIELPVVQKIIDVIAQGQPESRPGARDAVPPYPTKANQWLRYLRMLFSWGRRRGHNKTNPVKGAEQATERKEFKMPSRDAYVIALRHARDGGARKAHTAGSCPPYLWPIMEIAYLCRMRGIEVVDMTDAHETTEGLRAARRKGSNDNIVRWTPRLRAAWDAVLAIRTEILGRKANRGRPIPFRPEDRCVFVNRSGDRLSKGALDQAWQDFMAGLLERGTLKPEQRFTLHGLKHRGVTDTKGTKADKQLGSGHKSPQMVERYDHDVPVVDQANAPEFSGEFSGSEKT